MNLIFDNIVFGIQQTGGISRFWSKIVNNYLKKDNTYFIKKKFAVKKNLYEQNIDNRKVFEDFLLPISLSRYLNFSNDFLKEKYIFHSSYFRINKSKFAINITTVHDLMYEKFRTDIKGSLHIYQKKISLLSSDAIVCVSESTLIDLFYYYPFCKDKYVTVIPNGVDGFSRIINNNDTVQNLNFDIHINYFMFVGQRTWLKRFDLVFEVIKILEKKIPCVVVGNLFTKEELKYINKLSYDKLLINVGIIDDEQLNILYSNALFCFYPSDYEGFGIPLLEAMISGCPVLASNRSSIPEVVGDAAILFDIDIKNNLAEGVFKIMSKPNRNSIINAGINRASLFSWSNTIDQYNNLYTYMLGKNI